MDNTTIAYLIKVSISITLFYGIYILCLKNDTFFKLRRFYLLFTIVFSLIFPALVFEIPSQIGSNTEIPAYWLSEITLTTDKANSSTHLDIWMLIASASAIVSIMLASRFIVQILSIFMLRIKDVSENKADYRVIKVSKKDISPFSFFRWIFINDSNVSIDELEEIMLHEQIHVRQLHSIDTVLAEIFCIAFWWNPIAWLLRREIRINLEHLADKGVLKAGCDPKTYQYALLQNTCKTAKQITITNYFNVSLLKQRIQMINRRDTAAILSSKYLLVIPLSIILMGGNALKSATNISITSLDKPLTVYHNNNESSSQTTDRNNTEQPSRAKEKQIDHSVSTNIAALSQAENTETEKPFVTVEVMPGFPGGEKEMQRFIRDNLKYPLEAQEQGIQGRVTIRFVVEKDGQLSNITVVKGIDAECDYEAVRVLKSMPKWIPGRQNNENVAVYFNLPIQFKLMA